MTFDTECKRFLLQEFPGAVQAVYPNGVTVHIRDHMPDIKFKGKYIRTVQDYIHKHILSKVRAVLEDSRKNVQHYYGLLDRGGNMAKRLFTAHKRDGKQTVKADPPANEFTVPAEGALPDDWDDIIANRGMTRREVYPLVKRALIDVYTPPPGKFVVCDGAPGQSMTQRLAERMGTAAWRHVYGCTTSAAAPGQNMAMSSRDMLNTPVALPPVTDRYECAPETYKHEITEADLSAFFHVHKHIQFPGCAPGVPAGQIILIDSNDGDSVLAAILEAPDRIEPITGCFNSRVWVLLRGQERARLAAEKREADAELGIPNPREDDPIDGRDVYININLLFKLMGQHEHLRVAQYPQGMAVLLFILGGTDFFDDFQGDEHSLFFDMGWKKCIWDTWCNNKERFPNLIMVFYSGPAGYNQPLVCRRPYMDEEAVIEFFHECYRFKYGKVAADMFGEEKASIAQIREYTKTLRENVKSAEKMMAEKRTKLMRKLKKEGKTDELPPPTDEEILKELGLYDERLKKAIKKTLPPDAVLQRYARLALLNFSYWLNDYRPGGAEYCDPLEIYEGMPYYGFVLAEDGYNYKLSPIVSPARPVPDHVVGYMGAHLRQGQAQAEAETPRQREAE